MKWSPSQQLLLFLLFLLILTLALLGWGAGCRLASLCTTKPAHVNIMTALIKVFMKADVILLLLQPAHTPNPVPVSGLSCGLRKEDPRISLVLGQQSLVHPCSNDWRCQLRVLHLEVRISLHV